MEMEISSVAQLAANKLVEKKPAAQKALAQIKQTAAASSWPESQHAVSSQLAVTQNL